MACIFGWLAGSEDEDYEDRGCISRSDPYAESHVVSLTLRE